MKKMTAIFVAVLLLLQAFPVTASAATDWPDYRMTALGELMPFQPVDNYYSQQNPPSFTWPMISYATGYELKVAGNASMKEGIVTKDGVSKGVVTVEKLTTNVYSFPYAFQPDREYYWSVRFKYKGSLGIVTKSSEWSTPRRFYIDADAYTFEVPSLGDISGKLKAHPNRAVPAPETVASTKAVLQNNSAVKTQYEQAMWNFQFGFLKNAWNDGTNDGKGFELPSGEITATTEDELNGVTVNRTEDEARHKRMTNIQKYYWWPAQYMMLLASNRFMELECANNPSVPYLSDISYKGTAKKMLQEMLAKDDQGYYWDPARHFEIDVDSDTYEAMFVFSVAFVYDWLYSELSLEERAEAVKLIGRNLQRPFEWFTKERPLYEYPFTSHGWRMNQLTAAALMIYDETALINEINASNLPQKATLASEVESVTNLAKQIVQNHFPILSTVTYPFGYQDGASNEGPCYGLSPQHFCVALALSWMGIGDLTQKAWFQNSAKHMLYLYSSGWYNNWGDAWVNYASDDNAWKELSVYNSSFSQEEEWKSVSKQQLTKAYGEGGTVYINPYEPLTLFFNSNADTEAKLPASMPNGAYFPDRGWSALYSNIADENKIGLIYKANPYGTISHQHADNNAFIIQAYGEPLAVDSNYYDSYDSNFEKKYGYKAYAHNVITYDNAAGAQKNRDWSAEAYTTAYLNHSAVSLVAGDATKTFWNNSVNSSSKTNPIAKAQRSILYLKPDVFVVLDDMKSADSTAHTYEFWLNALGDIELNSDCTGATITRGAAALDAKVQFPAAQGTVITGFSGPDGLDTVSPPAKAFEAGIVGKGTDKRVYFQTAPLQQTRMITTLSVRKSAEEKQNITAENCGTYMKLTMEDGTAAYVNLTDAASVTTADGITFSGLAFVSCPDGGYMLHEGTRAMKDGVTLVEAEKAVSVSMNGTRDELAVSSIREDGTVHIYAPGTSKVFRHYDTELRGIPSGQKKSGVLWSTSGDQLNVTVYPGTYNLYLNDRRAPGTAGTGTITLDVNGTESQIPFSGYYNADGQLLSDWSYTASQIPAGEYIIEQAAGISMKEATGEFYTAAAGKNLMITSSTPVLKLKTLSKEFVQEGPYQGYVIIDSARAFEYIREEPSGNYYLTNDIALPASYVPIPSFTGKLIGADETNRKTITLHINDTANTNVGLFQEIGGNVVIQNIELAGSVKATSMTGTGVTRNVGTLSGVSNLGTQALISNCVNRADVILEDASAWGSYVSGFIGNMFGKGNYGTLDRLVNKGNLSGSASGAYGGIIAVTGNNSAQLKVTNCENYGTIQGKSRSGGIVGWAYNGALQNCYNAGTVTGGPAGGIVGDLGSNNQTFSVTGCCNIGSAEYPIGSGNTVITDCYYLGDTDLGIQGAVVKTASELKELLADTASAEFLEALNSLLP